MKFGPRATRTTMGLALLALLAGCKTWRPAAVSPERLVTDEQPSTVRVTHTSGYVVVLNHPMVVGDSIVAPSAPAPGTTLAPPRLGVVTGEIRSIEVPEFSPQRTAALAAGIAAISATWVGLVGGSGGQRPPNEPLPKFSLSIMDGIRWVLGLPR